MTTFQDVTQLLFRIVSTDVNPRQADELIDEMSQLLWIVSDLDPDASEALKHSTYVSAACAEAPAGDERSPSTARRHRNGSTV
jgi:hypothetical protein